jgi:co-chaperonin GroES (HSP10)
MKFRSLFLTLLLAAVTISARANTTTHPGTPTGEENKKSDIAGGVVHVDTKKPLSNVTVTAYSVTKKEKVVYTDANGNYSFSELKAGTYKLVFEKDGFKKVVREKVTIHPDEGCQLNIEMDDEDEFQIIPGTIFDFD